MAGIEQERAALRAALTTLKTKRQKIAEMALAHSKLLAERDVLQCKYEMVFDSHAELVLQRNEAEVERLRAFEKKVTSESEYERLCGVDAENERLRLVAAQKWMSDDELSRCCERLAVANAGVARLREKLDEAQGGHEMAADSVVKLRHELVKAERQLDALKAEVGRLQAKVAKAQAVALAWGDGDNDEMQAALLDLFLSLYGQAPAKP
jgi:chromosome segregation ATPase